MICGYADQSSAVIYHLGNKLIALWLKNSAREIHFTVEYQFCHELNRDQHSSSSSGEYFVILLDLLTVHPWRDQSVPLATSPKKLSIWASHSKSIWYRLRDHGSDQIASGMLFWLICSYHSVLLGTSSSGFISTVHVIWFNWRTMTRQLLVHMVISGLKYQYLICHPTVATSLYITNHYSTFIFPIISMYNIDTIIEYRWHYIPIKDMRILVWDWWPMQTVLRQKMIDDIRNCFTRQVLFDNKNKLDVC